MPIFGPPNIEQLKTERDVRGLIKALSYPNDPKIRRQAAAALTQIKDYRAMDIYVLMVRDSDANNRQAAAEAMGHVGDARAVKPLISLLQDEHLDIRRAATHSLGQVCIRLEDPTRGEGLIVARPEDVAEHDRGLGALVDSLCQHDAQVREEAANALSLVGWQPHSEKGWGDFWAAKRQWSALIILGAPAADSLVNLLSDWDPSIRQQALDTLGVIADPATAPTLINTFEDPDPSVRDAALDALHKLERNGYEALMQVIQNPKAELRKRGICSEALVHIGDYESILSLISYLGKPEPDSASADALQEAVVNALGERGDVHALRFLMHAYQSWVQQGGDKNKLFPLIAQRLRSIDDVIAIKTWVEVLGDKFHPFHDLAIIQLGVLGEGATDPILHDRAIDALVDYRIGQTGPLRHTAAESLQKLGWTPGYISRATGQPMPKTGPLQQDSLPAAPFISYDEEIQRKWESTAEVTYLATIGDATAVTALGDALRRGDLKIHMAAARALAHIGTEQALSELIDGLDTADWIKAAHVAEVLGETNNPMVIIPLVEKLSHPEGSVRRSAAQALVAIYRNAPLSTEQKQLILNERERMAQPFESHPDPKNPRRHIDQGIGITF